MLNLHKKIASFLFLICVFLRAIGSADLAEDLDAYTMPAHHPFYAKLERIFASSKTLDSERNFLKAGFTILQLRDPMFVIAMHPELPGHLVKVHLRASHRSPQSRWNNLITRCKNAAKLKGVIEKENIRYFTVPDKCIYTTRHQDPVLIVTRMNIVSARETKHAWLKHAKRKHIKELHCIISNGCGSSKLVENLPYTREGVFACIDTEKPSQGDRYIKKYLSKDMCLYWDELNKAAR